MAGSPAGCRRAVAAGLVGKGGSDRLNRGCERQARAHRVPHPRRFPVLTAPSVEAAASARETAPSVPAAPFKECAARSAVAASPIDNAVRMASTVLGLLLGEFTQQSLIALAVAAGALQPGANVDARNDKLGLVLTAARMMRRSGVCGPPSDVALGAPDPAQQHAEQLIGVDRLGDVIVHAGFKANLPIRRHARWRSWR